MSPGPVVIGNVGHELGQALAREICGRGYLVAGLASRADETQAAREAAGPLFRGFLHDPEDPGSIRELFREVRSQLGPVRILINGPSALVRRDILDESSESFMGTVNGGLGSIVRCTREAISDMVAEGRGRILMVQTEPPQVPATAASLVTHAAVQAFSRALVADLADRFPEIVVSQWLPRILQNSRGASGPAPFEEAAGWGAALALSLEPSLNGTIWIDDREVQPRRGLRRWVSDWLNGRQTLRKSIAILDSEALA